MRSPAATKKSRELDNNASLLPHELRLLPHTFAERRDVLDEARALVLHGCGAGASAAGVTV